MIFLLNSGQIGAIALTLTFIHTVTAVQVFDNSTVPTNLTTACTNALLNDLNCTPAVLALQIGFYYANSTLERTCTTDCANSLSNYRASIAEACDNETWVGDYDNVLPVVMIPDTMRYNFDLICMMDSGRYCNTVAADYAAFLDPTASHPVTGDPVTGGNMTDTTQCDLCFIKNLRYQAASPYYNGPRLANDSVYESMTSSCNVTGYPLTTTNLDFSMPTDSPTPTPTACAGRTYQIQSGDDCQSISTSQGIGTVWLLTDNDLTAYCADFPTNGTLCLNNTCDIYTVQTNDTCTSIASAHNITVSQFKAWNPTINAGCYNIDRMNGTQVCVSVPGRPYTAPALTTLAPTIPITAAPVPTDVAEGINQYCGRYYQAKLGDYCNMIVMKFGISLDDFIVLNPVINTNCTNLFAEESYCVQAVGDINTYSGRPGSGTTTITFTSLDGDIATLPDATYVTPTKSSTDLPLASDTRTDCNDYFDGDLFQNSINGSNWNSPCELAAAVFGVPLEDFGIWNPGLGNTSLSNCTFTVGEQYCGKLYFGEAPAPPEPTSDLPIREGTTTNCTEYIDVTDGWECKDILDMYSLTISQFFQYNPTVGSDCSSLWLDYQYCIRTPDYIYFGDLISSAASSAAASTAVSTAPPGPTQTGQPVNCKKWYTTQAGDSCSSVENLYFITSEQFLAWNPAVSPDCTSGFWLGYAYCVGTSDTIFSTRSSSPAAPSASVSQVPVPTPTQPNNIISNCNKYAQAKSGDYCYLFAQNNGITTAQLYAWNSVLGSDGSGCANSFWLGYWYCVGVSV
ncbi:LysM domain-containing protein [Wilcoxina mikolae CBS 423.85]|nr:LysM domain-containing protein [Wilcoxina mikolae CBS 423.85]